MDIRKWLNKNKDKTLATNVEARSPSTDEVVVEDNNIDSETEELPSPSAVEEPPISASRPGGGGRGPVAAPSPAGSGCPPGDLWTEKPEQVGL